MTLARIAEVAERTGMPATTLRHCQDTGSPGVVSGRSRIASGATTAMIKTSQITAAALSTDGARLWNVYGPTETTVWSSAALVC